MRVICALVLLLLLTKPASSQAGKSLRYSLSAEIGKTGLIYSVVFDNGLKDPRYGLRGGMGSNFGKYREAIMGLVGAYRLFGKGFHQFETGLDIHYLHIDIVSNDQQGASSLLYPNYSTQTFYITINAGYRMKLGKVLFRVGAAPGFTKDEFIPGGYVSGGFRF